MKRKKFILIGIAVFLLFEFVCISGYILLNRRLERKQYQYYCEIIQNDLQTNPEFESQYGEVVSVQLNKEERVEVLSNKSLLIPSIVTTGEGKQYGVLFEFFLDNDSYTVRYDDIFEITK